MSYIEIAQRDGGSVVRIKADNHETILSSGAQLYADDRDALEAIAIAAQAFGIYVRRPVKVLEDDQGAGIESGDGYLYTFRRVDERTAADADPQAIAVSITRAASQVSAAHGQLVDVVRKARGRGWSWAKIGRILGVSRQAAWERFHDKIDVD